MKIDFAKRRRVMERSQMLGHCICDVQRACPCDVLREQNICPCAGERPEPAAAPEVKLMAHTRNAGCSSKIAPRDLDAVLARLPAVNDPAVISGLAAADDAAIYRLTDDLCLVQTVDVFTPCVDDARMFGRICAANCLSDIYAMGGTPRTALSVLAFPSEKLPGEIIFQMMSGAMETFAEAGVALVGGHSVKDEEVKLGFAITGTIDPAVAAALERPGAGDVLVLTKPLGTGVLTFARQIGRQYPDGFAAAEASMMSLNRGAAEAMRAAGASACTDVTGFGLFAHLRRMLRGSGLGAEIFAEALPAFPGAVEALRQGIIPGGIERNREYVADAVKAWAEVDEAWVNLGLDPQTSGGLLIAIAPERVETLRRELSQRGAGAHVIGRLTSGTPGMISIRPGRAEAGRVGDVLATNSTKEPVMSDSPAETPAHGPDCCADVFGAASAVSTASASQKAFGELIRSVQAPGALDARTKELILFSLVVASRCEPCFEAHYRRAQELGITPTQLDEAAWCAIALGGAPVKMFYHEQLGRVNGAKK